MERRRARTPLKSCLRLSDLMWHSFFQLNDALNTPPFGITVRIGRPQSVPAQPSAEIVVLADLRQRAEHALSHCRQV
jgi:hypothetical protein